MLRPDKFHDSTETAGSNSARSVYIENRVLMYSVLCPNNWLINAMAVKYTTFRLTTHISH